jgi:hypothetical protein
MLCLGCPIGTILLMFVTLQKMKHFIGSAYGLSSTSFTSGDVSFQGLGQGNGAGPTGWTVVSAPIINMIRTAGYAPLLLLLFPVLLFPLFVMPLLTILILFILTLVTILASNLFQKCKKR